MQVRSMKRNEVWIEYRWNCHCEEFEGVLSGWSECEVFQWNKDVRCVVLVSASCLRANQGDKESWMQLHDFADI